MCFLVGYEIEIGALADDEFVILEAIVFLVNVILTIFVTYYTLHSVRMVEERDVNCDEIISNLRRYQIFVFFVKFVLRIVSFIVEYNSATMVAKIDFNIYW